MGSVTSDPLHIKFWDKEEIDFGSDAQNRKWRGGLRATAAIKASVVWAMVGDFCAIHKWAPSMESSKLVQGLPNVEGCVRYCESKLKTLQGEPMWVKEELLTLDSGKLLQAYRVLDSNMDFQDYSSTIRVLECGANSSAIEWFFELSPIVGKDENQIVASITLSMASKIQFLHEILSNQAPSTL